MSETQRIMQDISDYTYDVASVLRTAPQGIQNAMKESFTEIMRGYCDALTQAVEEEYATGACFQKAYNKSA